ncbi:MAG: hypothetical protein KGD70_08475 [Candidatus Lokiarchaeota archaeon]|nr:hypothetical protein [Candidatus Lokiarchaeota archaeon]
MIIKDLQTIFSDVSLNRIDSSEEIEQSHFYTEFLRSFPNLGEVFNLGLSRDNQEFERTIKHIFRSIKIYLKILGNTFSYKGFSNQTTSKLAKKIEDIQKYSSLIIPLILIYHDIGKFVRKRDHPQQSFILISERKLLSPFNLLENDSTLIQKVIQYHILFATIYTGESTYYGTYSLIKDSALVQIISDPQYLDLFVDLLEIFTYIDILGYSYSQMFDHYVIYYERISHKLKDIFRLLPNKEIAIQKALQYSKDSIDWRIAGGLRIFQFVGTKPYLTEEFYYNIIKASLESIPYKKLNFTRNEWELLKKNVLGQSCKIQIKYGLAFLMVLAFGSFSRASFNEDVKISHKLVLFWMLLCRETINRATNDEYGLWNVYILGIHNWWALSTGDFAKIDENLISSIIQGAESFFDEELREYTLNLDLSVINSH